MRTIEPGFIVICMLSVASGAHGAGDLVLRYTFERVDGRIVSDRSGQGHDATIHGGATIVHGDFGTAIRLDGIDDYLRCAPAPGLDTASAFTVEAWLFAERIAGGIFSRHTGPGWTDQRLVLAGYERDGKPHAICAIADGRSSLKATPPPVPLNRWVHLAVAFDGTYVRIYHDGTLRHTNHAARPFLPLIRDVPILIGRSQGIGRQPFFKGLVGEVRCYRRSLSSREIFGHASAGVSDLIRAASSSRKRKDWKKPNVRTIGFRDDGSVVVPTEQTLRPAGRSITFPGRPVDLALSRDGRWLVATTTNEIVLIHTEKGLRHRVRLPKDRGNSLHGILFAPDSRTVFVAGHRGQVERLRITNEGKLELDEPRRPWKSALCGMTFSTDGRYAYAAASPSNRLLVLSSEMDSEIASVPTGVAPYSVVHGPDRKLYVSNWGGRPPREGEPSARTDGARVRVDPQTGLPAGGTVTVLRGQGRSLNVVKSIDVGRFPCQLQLSPDRTRLYVPDANDDTITVIDTASDTVIKKIPVRPDRLLPYGSQPVALACSPDGRTLYVANATNNAIAVVKEGKLAGMIPVGWFPGAIQINEQGTMLFVANVRGFGAEAEPTRDGRHVGDFLGIVSIIEVPDEAQLARYTEQVAENNRQTTPLMRHRPRKPTDRLVPVPMNDGESSVFEHVIYIIKENHSYDQDLGDMPEGNGEPRLCSAPQRITPNQHKLARQFVLLDNYHVPSDQSPSGHIWISQAICSSYWEKAITTWPRYYSYEGKDALAFSSSGFLWTHALAHGLTFRNYGEYTRWHVAWTDPQRKDEITFTDVWRDFQKGRHALRIVSTTNVESLRPHTHPGYPGYGYLVTDVQRARIFIEDLERFEREGGMPNLVWLWLPNNHTSGSRPGFPTATSQIADNDMALGLVVEAVSKSRFWPKTVIFCTEDDPWNGTDHVAGSRSMCFIASPCTKRGQVISRLYTLTGLIKTIELILGLPMMNQLDLIATPLTDCFVGAPDATPYAHVPSNVPLDELNPPLSRLQGRELYWARKSLELPLMTEPDAFPEHLETFKRLAWHTTMDADDPYTYVDEDGRIVTEQSHDRDAGGARTSKERRR
ncbi:MAG: hypothetical protein CMJ18_17575 [Phycisphaeraceae bacterium]|nr:hypothetical protein [Phycisphaeraceae bacterium]